ncbi:MAG: aldo/keto reductase [Sedimenticola sp.]|nr:MAG: aldo/keto reductase [Sedimenticola sp.]
MNRSNSQMGRRKFMKMITGLVGSCWLTPASVFGENHALIKKSIASTGEQIPVIGMGSSRTFESIGDESAMTALAEVLQAFFEHGGTLIDSSPMYGSAEQVIGTLLKTITPPSDLFAATKVWTDGKQNGIEQMERSRKLWGVKQFDLMQIHNLRDWQTHLETLQAMKAEGELRHIGITTSHGRYHDQLQSILEKYPFDFVQFTYNITERETENRLLPLAMERGTSVIINRPFARGSLFRKTKGRPLPDWTAEIDCNSWGQFFLKYAVSHPAVTCAIPATSKVHHMIDNMGAGTGRLPDAEMRKRMEHYFAGL